MQAQPRNQPTLEDARDLYFSGQFLRAIPVCKRLLKAHRNNPDVLFVLGACEVSASLFDEGKEHLEKAIKRKPTDPHFYRPLATVHLMYGRMDEAHAALDRALSFNASFAPVIADKAELLILEGNIDEARALIEPLVESNPQDGRVASTYARLCRNTGEYDKGVRTLEAFLARPNLKTSQRIGPEFRLALLYDKLGRYDDSFRTLKRANALVKPVYDPASIQRIVDALIDSWTPRAIAALPRPAAPETDRGTPVFIVGMPRSGTSLVEQILASHPDVFGAGELDLLNRAAVRVQTGTAAPEPSICTEIDRLTAEQLSLASSEYLRARDELCPTDAPLVCDKLPTNFFNLGLVHAMFPGARVVHCMRTPLDTIFSCYSHHFAGSLPFTYDLEHLAAFYIQYERLMAHWRSVLPETILDVPYERLVEDPEPMIRAMLDLLDLQWDERCLEFHTASRVTRTASNEQVREPLYKTSVGRWKGYESHLEPARRILEDA